MLLKRQFMTRSSYRSIYSSQRLCTNFSNRFLPSQREQRKMNSLGIIFVICIPILLFNIGVNSTAHRSKFGEPCNSTYRCDRKSLLNCESETCICIKPDEMIFESSTGKCGTKAGEQCKYMIETTDGQIAYEIQKCVEDAVCDSEGFCACREYFTETVNGTCTPSLNQQYREPCDAKLQCSADFGLECRNNLCNCNIASEFSTKRGHCVGLADQPCILSACRNNSRCTGDATCKCNTGYFKDKVLSTCLKQLERLDPCTYDDQCENVQPSLQLSCVNKVCNCDPENSLFGTIQDFSPEKQVGGTTGSQCLGKEGHPCILGHCAGGALCSYQSDNTTGVCVCQPEHFPTGTGKCATGKGGKCESSEMCLPGLVCKDSVCSCRYSDKQTYSEIKGECVTMVGGPCTDQTSCTDHAVCSGSQCHCMGGFVRSAEGRCELSHGSSCNGSVKCDSAAQLVCINGTCQCDTYSEYSSQFRKCLKYVGSECSIRSSQDECDYPGFQRVEKYDSYNDRHLEVDCLEPYYNWKRECVLGAYCKPINENLQGVCQCKAGFTGSGSTCSKITNSNHYYG